MRPITFSGVLPPPVNGMTSMSAVMVHALSEVGPVRCYNWSHGKPSKGWRWKIVRFTGFVKSTTKLLLGSRRVNELLYYPANSGTGLYYDMVIISIARLRGYAIALHHHTYSYLDRHDWRMAWINQRMGPNDFHVVHCQMMVDDFRRQYVTQAQFLLVPPTIVSQGLAKVKKPKTPRSQMFTIGFLSNLTFAKGLDQVLATFEQIAQTRSNVRLVLAGPIMGKAEQKRIAAAVAQWPRQCEYRGPVYGEKKGEFFSELDVFLFPTCYRNESWGIVLTEAMSVGCPVIAYDRGCVPHILTNDAGLVIPRAKDFLSHAIPQIEQWIDSPKRHQQARHQSMERSEQLERDATEQIHDVVERLQSSTIR